MLSVARLESRDLFLVETVNQTCWTIVLSKSTNYNYTVENFAAFRFVVKSLERPRHSR